MAYRFELVSRDGEILGSFLTSEQRWQAGDVVIGHGHWPTGGRRSRRRNRSWPSSPRTRGERQPGDRRPLDQGYVLIACTASSSSASAHARAAARMSDGQVWKMH